MIRADLSSIPTYVPGVRREGAVKISSNESAHPPLPGVAAAMAAAAAGANRYPDMGTQQLRTAPGAHLDLDPDRIAVGCGSSALCQQLVQITCTPGDEVIFAWRSFEAYPIFAQVVGARPVKVPLDAAGKHDLDAMAQAITPRTRLIFVCNPNNPSGTTITQAEFAQFMARVPDNVLVALDEAYTEFHRNSDTPDARAATADYPNLVGLRTFSKAYGLAGVRVGYAFGPADVIAALNKVAIPFGVNAVGQAGAVASLEASAELLQRTEEVVVQRARLAAALRPYGALDSQANFVWVPTPAEDPEFPARTAAALADHNVLVRAFPEGLRITVTTEEETDAVLAAWEAAVGGTSISNPRAD
ncbi:histidinol-phosphate transaminase [Corynebacterium sp. Marseille-Q2516]